MHQIKNSRILKQWGSLFIVIFFYCVYTSNCQRDFDYRDEYLLRSGGNVRPDYSEDPRGKRIGNFRKNWILGGIKFHLLYLYQHYCICVVRDIGRGGTFVTLSALEPIYPL